MKTFAKKSISTLKSLVSVRKKHFGKIFAVDGVSFTKPKTDFRKIFLKAPSSQNLENSGFWPIFHPIFSYKESQFLIHQFRTFFRKKLHSSIFYRQFKKNSKQKG